MADSWSNIEVKLIVADYFDMFSDKLKGIPYSKAEHSRSLIPLLRNRTRGSIEFKHQNISAVLVRLGLIYLNGYVPLYNYQRSLEEEVILYLTLNPSIELQFKIFADKPIQKPKNKIDFERIIFDQPFLGKVFEPEIVYNRNPIKINYLESEQSNRILGSSGEELVMDYERWDLTRNGKEKLANQIRWVSKEDGDGAGFDILSKNLNGKDKYIEVKTTKLGKETPFYFSRNELSFSQIKSDSYHLYRLFNFEEDAKMFIRNGDLGSICHCTPTAFTGIIKC